MLPTAPPAADTTTVSPALGAPISSIPHHAVRPGIPTAPRYAESGIAFGSTFCNSAPVETPYCCHPKYPVTESPGVKLGLLDSTTSPTVPPTITCPIATLAAYEG